MLFRLGFGVIDICCSYRYQRLQFLVSLLCLFSWLWSVSVFIQKESVPCNSLSYNLLCLYWSLIEVGCGEGSFAWACRSLRLFVGSCLGVVLQWYSTPTYPVPILFHGCSAPNLFSWSPVPLLTMCPPHPPLPLPNRWEKSWRGQNRRKALPSPEIKLWQSSLESGPLLLWRRLWACFLIITLLLPPPRPPGDSPQILNMRSW